MLIGRGIRTRIGQAVLAIALTGLASPSLAATTPGPITAYYPDPAVASQGFVFPGPPQAVLTVDVLASVGGRCGFAAGNAPSGTVNAGSIDKNSWTQDVPFVVECAAPWRIAVSSQNGALSNPGSTVTGYANRAPYDVALTLPYDTGTTSGTVTGSCPVAQLDQALSSSSCTFKGTATTTNGLVVQRSVDLAGSKMTLSAPAYPGPSILINGTYTDTLTVTVSPSV